MAVPQLDVAGSNSAPAAKKEACGKKASLVTGEALSDAAPTEGVSDEKDTPAPTSPLSWDEIMEMLKRVSCFTDFDAPSTKMLEFFLITKRISVNMGGEPPSFVSARLPFGTLESAMFRIQQL